MKSLLAFALILLSVNLIADVPRVDILKVSFEGKIYYTKAITRHLEFKEGCVFDIDNNEYLYERDVFFKEYFNNRSRAIELYSDAIVIPFTKIYSEQSHILKDNPSGNLISLNGEKRSVKSSSFDSLTLVKIIIGNNTGYIHSKLTHHDMVWINDYPLEVISSFNDMENCDLELVTIKGNVPNKEANQIKENSIYCSRQEIRHI